MLFLLTQSYWQNQVRVQLSDVTPTGQSWASVSVWEERRYPDQTQSNTSYQSKGPSKGKCSCSVLKILLTFLGSSYRKVNQRIKAILHKIWSGSNLDGWNSTFNSRNTTYKQSYEILKTRKKQRWMLSKQLIVCQHLFGVFSNTPL